MLHVGQKVGCVNTSNPPGTCPFAPSEQLIKGEIYTVIKSFIWPGGIAVVHLAEIARDEISRLHHGPDVGYGAWRFRPIVERKTDISIFTEMLTPTPGRVREMSEG